MKLENTPRLGNTLMSRILNSTRNHFSLPANIIELRWSGTFTYRHVPCSFCGHHRKAIDLGRYNGPGKNISCLSSTSSQVFNASLRRGSKVEGFEFQTGRLNTFTRRESRAIMGMKMRSMPSVCTVAVKPICQQNHFATGIGFCTTPINQTSLPVFESFLRSKAQENLFWIPCDESPCVSIFPLNLIW